MGLNSGLIYKDGYWYGGGGGGSEYTAGTGIDIDNNEISVETMSASDLQEVKDAFVPNTGAPARMLNYSTDEQVVGTWIDGKPLYQKTVAITVPTPSTNGELAINEFPLNIDNVEDYVNIFGYYKSSVTNGYNTFNRPMNGGYMCNTYISNGILKVENSAVNIGGRTGHVTFQYTKTTD